MRNILIVKWYDALKVNLTSEHEQTLNEISDYLDIVQSLRHIEMKIQPQETWDSEA
jgi:hypothetical protein